MKRISFNSKKSGLKLLSLLFIAGLTFAACSQDYDDQVGDLQSKYTANSTAIADLNTKIQTLQAQHDADVKTLQAAIKDAQAAAEAYAKAQADAAKDAAVKDSKAYADAQDAVVLAQAKEYAAKAVADASAEIMAALATQKAELQAEIAAAKADILAAHAADVADLKAKDAAIEAELAAKVAEIQAAHAADIAALNAKIDALNGRVESLEAWKATAEVQIAANKDAIAALKGDVEALQQALADFKTATQTKITALQNKDTELAAKDTELQNAINEVKAVVAALQTKDAELYADIVANAKQIKALQDKDAELAAKLAEVETAIATAKVNIENELKAVKEGAANDLKAAKEALQAQINALNTTVSGLGDALAVLQTRPTTIIFKPYTFIGGIEAFEFNPVYYTAYENADNKENTAINGLVAAAAPTYVAMPGKIEYEVNPWNTTLDWFKINDAKFNFHTAVTRTAPVEYLKVAANHEAKINNHILSFYINEVTDGAEALWKKAEAAADLANGESNAMMFAVEIPLANEAGSVVSDYARLTEVPFDAYFRICKPNDCVDCVKPLYNDSKAAIYENDPATDAPVYVAPTAEFFYEFTGLKYDQEFKLIDYVATAEYDTKYDAAGTPFAYEPYIVDEVKWTDLGFQYRFYVPLDGEAAVNKSADKNVYYKGPKYGPWGYAAAGTDFQTLIKTIDHKTGAVTFDEKVKGLTPIVLVQVVDPNHDYQVVTEAYVRLVVDGDKMVDVAEEVTTYANCTDDFIEIPYFAAQVQDSIYDKFGIDKTQFETYWTKTVDGVTGAVVEFNAAGDLVAKVPYAALADLKTTGLQDFTVKYTAKLGGNTAEITYKAHVGLPTIELSYMNTYWKSMPDAANKVPGVIVGNPRPVSELTYSAFASYDFSLLDGYNTQKAVTGFAQDAATGIYYKVTWQGKDVTADFAGCVALDVVPVTFTQAAGADKFVYADGTDKTFKSLAVAYNEGVAAYSPANYVEAIQQNGTPTVYNLQLVEKDIAPAINGLWGSDKAIKLLDDDAKVPCLVYAYYKYNGVIDERVIDEFMIDYEKPIYVVNNDRAIEIIDALHAEQPISFDALIQLKDWLGENVTAHFVNTNGHTTTVGDFSADNLSIYYNVQNPEWKLYTTTAGYALTDLKVNPATNNLEADPALVEKFLAEGIKNEADFGPLPDGVSLKDKADGNFYYNNVGGLVKEDYHMFLEATLKHKWGEIPARIVVTVKAHEGF